jgi:hypothetical protein
LTTAVIQIHLPLECARKKAECNSSLVFTVDVKTNKYYKKKLGCKEALVRGGKGKVNRG